MSGNHLNDVQFRALVILAMAVLFRADPAGLDAVSAVASIAAILFPSAQ